MADSDRWGHDGYLHENGNSNGVPKPSSPRQPVDRAGPLPPSPSRRSPSPRRRSPSPRRRSPSPRRRSPSPRKRSPSPRRRSPSPRRRSPSPRRRSPSPRRRSPSPRKRSPSPRRRSPSPLKRSSSPRRRSPSPRRRSPSPLKRSSSPRRRSPSPRKRTLSPRRRSPRRSPSPVRSRSPGRSSHRRSAERSAGYRTSRPSRSRSPRKRRLSRSPPRDYKRARDTLDPRMVPAPAYGSSYGGDYGRAPSSYTGREEQGRYGLDDVQVNYTSSSAPKIDFDKYDDIPVETSGRDVPREYTSFDEARLAGVLNENIRNIGYTKPTPVQKHALSIVLHNRDLMACAQTGSGKTAAFLLPIIEKLLTDGAGHSELRRGRAYPSALILAPTRELACQIQDETRKFCLRTGLKSTVLYGGSPITQQLRILDGGCDILVATPGRLGDIYERGRVSLSMIRYLVLDEADRMLDMGFEPQIRKIVEQSDMPSKSRRRTLMFSATFPKEIQLLASQFLSDYIFLAVGRVGGAAELVTQKFIRVEEFEKQQALIRLLGSSPRGRTLIFVETKRSADMLGHLLARQGFPATSIHGDRQQRERTMAIRTFSTGQTPFLVATNVAARGLDIDDVTHVINYDMPGDIDDYVHRIGRTGRAGKKGLATSLVTPANANVVGKLIDVLDDSHQEVPQWLEAMKADRVARGSRGRGRGGHRFGGRDFRMDKPSGGHYPPPLPPSGPSYAYPPSSYPPMPPPQWGGYMPHPPPPKYP